jgi:hypothetical protein
MWRTIKSAPRDGTPVLLTCRHDVLGQRRYEFGRFGIGGKWYRQDGTVIDKPATHWMPLPAPPADGEG